VIEAGLAGALYFSSLLAAAAAAAASSLRSVRCPRSCPASIFSCAVKRREHFGDFDRLSPRAERRARVALMQIRGALIRRFLAAEPKKRAFSGTSVAPSRSSTVRSTVRSKFAFVALALFALRDAKLDKA